MESLPSETDKYTPLLSAISRVAHEMQIPIEDLAVWIAEGTSLNCPEIYRAIRSFTGEQ